MAERGLTLTSATQGRVGRADLKSFTPARRKRPNTTHSGVLNGKLYPLGDSSGNELINEQLVNMLKIICFVAFLWEVRACFDDFYAPSVFTSSSSELWAPSLCLYDGLIGEGVVPPSRIYTLRQSGTNGGGEGAEENESCSGHGRNQRKAWHHSNRLGKKSFTIDGRSQTP